MNKWANASVFKIKCLSSFFHHVFHVLLKKCFLFYVNLFYKTLCILLFFRRIFSSTSPCSCQFWPGLDPCIPRVLVCIMSNQHVRHWITGS